jgi:DNA-binding protein H-NS
MVSARLAQIQENLNDLYEQLGGKEKALIQETEEEKIGIQQEIREIKKKIQKYEEELECLGLKLTSTITPRSVVSVHQCWQKIAMYLVAVRVALL